MTYQKFKIKKFFHSFTYASKGVINLFKTEQNARFHFATATVTAIAAYLLKVTRIEATILFFAFVMVLAIEIINTAIEKLIDIVHPDNHSGIAFIKDAMAGAVLIAAIIAFVVGILIFYPHIAALL
jgi:diacylglycerol kinase